MNHRKIILIGMPGAGKSTLGHPLSQALGFGFVDLDDLIEKLSGQSISDLFRISESHFRDQETAALKSAFDDEQPLVIASGGGTPCFNDNLSLILAASLSIFLDPPMSILVERTEKESHRPLLQGRDTLERLTELYNQRRTYYKKASITVKEASPNVQEVIRLIEGFRS